MRNNKVMLIPVGGLANRMRAVVSAIELCSRNGSLLEIVWFKDRALNARFDALFEPIRLPGVSVREARAADYLLYDRPRRRNGYLPALFQRVLFRNRLYEREASRLDALKVDFPVFDRGGRTYVASCYQMTERPASFAPLVPLPQLRERIDAMARAFRLDECIGVHIRRGDNAVSIRRSPDHLFLERMTGWLEEGCCSGFYLATDSDEVKRTFGARFGDALRLFPKAADRLHTEGIQDALVELYLLARCRRILGSAGSSFSETASFIGAIPYGEVEK